MLSKPQKDRAFRLIAERKAFKYNMAKYIEYVDDTGDTWKFSLQCDEKTPYSKDKIFIIFKIPGDYPNSEPEAWVEKPERFMHPNIGKDGKVCYCGQTKPGPTFHILDRLYMIKQLFQEPNPKDVYILQYAEMFLDNKELWFTESEKKFNEYIEGNEKEEKKAAPSKSPAKTTLNKLKN